MNSHDKVRGPTGQVPDALKWKECPRETKSTNEANSGARIYHSWRSSCLRQDKKVREVGTGTFVALLAPGKIPTTPLAFQK